MCLYFEKVKLHFSKLLKINIQALIICDGLAYMLTIILSRILHIVFIECTFIYLYIKL